MKITIIISVCSFFLSSVTVDKASHVLQVDNPPARALDPRPQLSIQELVLASPTLQPTPLMPYSSQLLLIPLKGKHPYFYSCNGNEVMERSYTPPPL